LLQNCQKKRNLHKIVTQINIILLFFMEKSHLSYKIVEKKRNFHKIITQISIILLFFMEKESTSFLQFVSPNKISQQNFTTGGI